MRLMRVLLGTAGALALTAGGAAALADDPTQIRLVEVYEMTPGRTSSKRASEVYAFVNKELREVLPLLPNVRSNVPGSYYGRITRPVVFFLLARLALNAEVYADDDPTDGHRPSGDTMRLDVNGRTVNAWRR